MLLFGINLWQIILPIVLFPIIAGVGVVVDQNAQNNNFLSQKINPVQFRTADQNVLTPARDITSDWMGSGNVEYGFANDNLNSPRCIIKGVLTLHLNQQDNNLNGTWDYNPVGEVTETAYAVGLGMVPQGCHNIWMDAAEPNNPIQNGVVSSTTISYSSTDFIFQGSFTTDLMILNMHWCTNHACGAGNIAWLQGNFKLTRQQ